MKKRFSLLTPMLFCALSLPLLLPAGCSAPSNSQSVAETEAKPEVMAWMNAHPEIGTLARVEAVDPWAQGDRQRVITQNDRHLLFYLQAGEVVSVYDQTGNGRVTVYQRNQTANSSSAPTASAPVSQEREIRYVVMGTTPSSTNGSISYPNGYLRNEPLPWSKVETAPIETSVNLDVAGVGNDGEFFIAEIYVDGRLIARDEGQNAGAKVTCDAKGCDDF